MNANTDLIPITRLKISKEKWLETQIKYDEGFLVKDVVDMTLDISKKEGYAYINQ